MKYREKLQRRTAQVHNSLCMGMDPILSKIPLQGKPAQIIRNFYESILNEMVKARVFPAAVKPNIAFYEALGLDCLAVLKDLIGLYQQEGMLVILDAKRGDIGKTSRAYADMAFQVYGADAVTVAPYMGGDSVTPFLENYPGRGVYILCRTSNPTAVDFQMGAPDGGLPLYRQVAAKISEWDQGDIGAVVGATAPSELADLISYWKGQGSEIPTLIPGISLPGVSGGQGGSLSEILATITGAGGDPGLHLINSSSGINYAYERFPDVTYATAAVKAIVETLHEFARGT